MGGGELLRCWLVVLCAFVSEVVSGKLFWGKILLLLVVVGSGEFEEELLKGFVVAESRCMLGMSTVSKGCVGWRGEVVIVGVAR